MNPSNANDPDRNDRAVASMLSFLGMSEESGISSAGGSPEPPPLLVTTPDQLNHLLRGFEERWNPEALAVLRGRLPSEGTFRRLGLTRLVKIDLRKRWERGERALLETYLANHAELGTPEEVAPDLVWAEWEARKACGALDREEINQRFPRQAAILSARDTPPPGETVTPLPVALPVDESVSPGAAELSGQFGRYRIEKKLGEGGMGAVYLAHDTTLDRPVALKVPRPNVTARPEGRERFFREARAASALHHPNLCPVYDFGEVGGAYYLSMAYVEGKALSDLVRGAGPLPPREVAALVRKLALAMQAAHEKGVIHRDLKPANVLITSQREPVITDFGLARRDHSDDVQLTRDGEIMGTPAYMAPEQADGGGAEAGPACDIYSLGVILYELLTGQRPFQGTMVALLYAQVHQAPTPPSRLRPGLDPALESICLKAMAKQPQDRHANMGEFAEALRAYLEGRPQAPADSPQPPPLPGDGSVITTEGVTSQLMAELLSRLDRRPQASGGHRWVWVTIAAAMLILSGSVVFLATRDFGGGTTVVNNDNRVTVQLVGVIVNVQDTTLVFELNGQRVDPRELQGDVSLPVGTNTLVIKRGEEVIETRTFDVTEADAGKKVEPLPDPAAKVVTVQLKTLPIDKGEKGLRFVLDGKAVSLDYLQGKLELRHGLHVLVVYRGTHELGRHVFAIGSGDTERAIELTGADYRRVEVTLTFTHVKVADAALALLDGSPISTADLGRPMKLLPGPHEIVILDPAGEVKQTFTVGAKEGKQKIEVTARPEGPPPTLTLALLCEQLQDKDPEVRKAAAEALERKGDRGAVHALVRRVADGNWYIPRIKGKEDPVHGGKEAALRALRKLGKPEEVTAALIAALSGKEGHQRLWALKELAEQDDRARAVPSLRTLVTADNWYDPSDWRDDNKTIDQDPDWGGKGEALKLLRQLAPEQVTAALLEAMFGKHYAMRLWATRELGAQNDPADRTLIIAELKKRIADDLWYDREATNIEPDPKGGGKAEALKLLRELDRPSALEPLTVALFSPKHPDQRTWAARELAVQNDKKAIPALKRRVADNTWDERTPDNKKEGHGKVAALEAIRTLDATEVENAIAGALKSSNPKVKTWALSQIGTDKKEPTGADKDGWVALFNGKDVSGWKTHPDDKATWVVEDGILVGRGKPGHLFTERDDFADFHLRVEAKINDGGNSGVYFRSEFGSFYLKRSYEAQINVNQSDPQKTGGIHGWVHVKEAPHKVDEWFTLEVIAQGDELEVKVNGKTTATHRDKAYSKGHIALQQFGAGSVVQFRKVEIREIKK